MGDLKREFEFYLANKADFLAKYSGKVVVLKDQEVLGVYDDRLQAVRETMKDHELGSFLVQLVVEGSEEVRFHSRVGL